MQQHIRIPSSFTQQLVYFRLFERNFRDQQTIFSVHRGGRVLIEWWHTYKVGIAVRANVAVVFHICVGFSTKERFSLNNGDDDNSNVYIPWSSSVVDERNELIGDRCVGDCCNGDIDYKNNIFFNLVFFFKQLK